MFALLTHLPVFNIEYPQENTTRIKDYEEKKCKAANELKLPSLHTLFKNYPTVDCGKSRYGGDWSRSYNRLDRKVVYSRGVR